MYADYKSIHRTEPTVNIPHLILFTEDTEHAPLFMPNIINGISLK